MNRREFNTRVLAAGAVSGVPVPLAAGPVPAATPVAVANLLPWAERFARVRNACSPDLLANAFNLNHEVAQTLCQSLLRKGAITAPGAAGVSKAARPIYQAVRFPGAHPATIIRAPAASSQVQPRPSLDDLTRLQPAEPDPEVQSSNNRTDPETPPVTTTE